MKIIKTMEECLASQERARQANIGCGKCPCCNSRNVSYSFTRSWYGGFLWKKKYQADRYKCMECGTVYESEVYER